MTAVSANAGRGAAKAPGVLTNTTNTVQPFTAKLTQLEHDVLKAHRGCFHCRLFYAGHYSPGCPLGANGRPTPEACKNVTLASALKAKAAFEANLPTVVAAVFGENSDKDFAMDEDEADEYMSMPLSLPLHLWWDCCIDGPMTCAPTLIRALIDHGSPPVLILSEFVDILGLVCHKLYQPFPVTSAFINAHRNLDASLSEYCKLRLQSPDSSWKAKVVNAIICPNLYMDVILGLDFLSKNKIILDTELRTAIAKETQYDLLNPPKVGPLPMRNPTQFNLEAHTSYPPCTIAAIRMHIEQLASLKILEKLDSTFKERFADRFPTDIPHAKDLPTDVYHHIEVKAGAPISVGQAYSCPRKY
ncbi:hypothetical protein L208DRAFT_1244428 [Tricholoma matsutake]|nr:hypothetical protein L208DRAFT_1244428 [Tricholoma matsutake 945]